MCSFPFQSLIDHKHRMKRSYANVVPDGKRLRRNGEKLTAISCTGVALIGHLHSMCGKNVQGLHVTEFKRVFTVWNKMEYNCYRCSRKMDCLPSNLCSFDEIPLNVLKRLDKFPVSLYLKLHPFENCKVGQYLNGRFTKWNITQISKVIVSELCSKI